MGFNEDFPEALALSAMSQLLLITERMFYYSCSMCPDMPHSLFYSGVLLLYKVLPGRAGQGHLSSRIPQTCLMVSILFFLLIVPQGGAGTGLRDSPPFREHTHPQYIAVFASLLILSLFMSQGIFYLKNFY